MTRDLTRVRSVGRVSWRVQFKPEDLWVGAFWRRCDWSGFDRYHEAWVCVIPMLPINLHWGLEPFDA